MSGDNTLTVPLLNNFFNAEITIQCSGLYYLRTLYKPSLFNINTESMLGFLYFYRLYAIVYWPGNCGLCCESMSLTINNYCHRLYIRRFAGTHLFNHKRETVCRKFFCHFLECPPFSGQWRKSTPPRLVLEPPRTQRAVDTPGLNAIVLYCRPPQ